MSKAQACYKRYFDRRTRKADQYTTSGDFSCIDSETRGGKKLGNHEIVPYEVLDLDNLTFIIQRGDVVEQFNSYRETKASTPAYEERKARKSKLEKKIRDVSWK